MILLHTYAHACTLREGLLIRTHNISIHMPKNHKLFAKETHRENKDTHAEIPSLLGVVEVHSTWGVPA
jgi:hypothetical protein